MIPSRELSVNGEKSGTGIREFGIEGETANESRTAMSRSGNARESSDWPTEFHPGQRDCQGQQ
jgi:hypothetical protein